MTRTPIWEQPWNKTRKKHGRVKKRVLRMGV